MKPSEKISCLFNTFPLFDQSVIGGTCTFKQKVNYSPNLYCQIDKQRTSLYEKYKNNKSTKV